MCDIKFKIYFNKINNYLSYRYISNIDKFLIDNRIDKNCLPMTFLILDLLGTFLLPATLALFVHRVFWSCSFPGQSHSLHPITAVLTKPPPTPTQAWYQRLSAFAPRVTSELIQRMSDVKKWSCMLIARQSGCRSCQTAFSPSYEWLSRQTMTSERFMVI